MRALKASESGVPTAQSLSQHAPVPWHILGDVEVLHLGEFLSQHPRRFSLFAASLPGVRQQASIIEGKQRPLVCAIDSDGQFFCSVVCQMRRGPRRGFLRKPRPGIQAVGYG
jgi:hypothetical protein